MKANISKEDSKPKQTKILQMPKEVENENKEVKKVMNLSDVLTKEGISNFEDFAAILSLPEEEFGVISELILSEIEKALNDSNNIVLLKKEMEMYGLSQEELVNEYANLMNAVDTLSTEMSQQKVDFIKRYLGLMVNAFTEGMESSKRIVEIPIQLLDKEIKIPKYAHIGDAGIDVYAAEDIDIAPGETKLVKTGIKIAIPRGFEMQVRPRSGLSLKTKMRVANAPGTIDAPFRGEVGIIIDNIEPPIKDITYEPILNEDKTIKELKITSVLHGAPCHIQKGDRIAQLVLSEIAIAHFYEVEDIKVFDSDRGENGFGSSGK